MNCVLSLCLMIRLLLDMSLIEVCVINGVVGSFDGFVDLSSGDCVKFGFVIRGNGFLVCCLVVCCCNV